MVVYLSIRVNKYTFGRSRFRLRFGVFGLLKSEAIYELHFK